MSQLKCWCVLLALVIISVNLHAQDDFFETIELDLESNTGSDRSLSYSGFLRQELKYGLESPETVFPFERTEQGINVVQTELFGEVASDFRQNGRFKLSAKVEQDWVQWNNGDRDWVSDTNLYVKDAYVDFTFNNGLWLRVGNQLFALGESEGLVITDVLSPRDMREPGQSELQDIREQIPAVLISYPVNDFKFSAILSYDASYNLNADEQEEFYPYLSAKENQQKVLINEPDQNWEYALKFDYQFNGGDLSVIAAQVNNNQLTLSGIEQQQFDVIQQYDQLQVDVLGLSFSMVKGGFILKGEVGRHWGRPVFGSLEEPIVIQNQWRSMLGLSYTSRDQWIFSFELNNKYSDDLGGNNVEGFDLDRTEFGTVIRIRKSSYNERLTNQFYITQLTGDQSRIYRWDSKWQWSDNLSLGARFVIYESKETASTFYPYRDNDVFNVSITYNF